MKAEKVTCPFCSGTKVTPYTRAFKNQDCSECDKDGLISVSKLNRLGLNENIGNFMRCLGSGETTEKRMS